MNQNYPQSKVPPWKHQVDCWNLAKSKQNFYVAHDMGCIQSEAIVPIYTGKHQDTYFLSLSQIYSLMYRDALKLTPNDSKANLYLKKIKPGTDLFTFSITKTGFVKNKIEGAVYQGRKRCLEIVLTTKETLFLTDDHPVLTYDAEASTDKEQAVKWVEALLLKPGDLVAYYNDTQPKRKKVVSFVKIAKVIEKSQGDPQGYKTVYDLVMAEPHRNFTANGIVVHNCGKTKYAIDDINGFDSRSVLVICPAKVIPNWKKQFAINSAYEGYDVISLSDGSSSDKAKAMVSHMDKCSVRGTRPVVVTNYETFWREPFGCTMSSTNKYAVKKFGLLHKYRWGHIIYDEIHRIKSPGGVASMFAKRLRGKADRILGLSGTPMPHSPLDIYAQMRAIDPTIFGTSYSAFKAAYAVMGGFQNKQVLRYINLDELTKKFFEHAHYVSADDALDLPPYSDITVECTLDPKTMQIYHQLDKDFIAEVDSGVITVDNALEKLLRLQQITTGHVVFEDKKEKYIDNNKIDTMLEIVEDLNPTEPVVIFYLFKQEGDRLAEGLKKLKRTVARISGAVDEQELFESGVASVALVQIQSGCEGLDNLKRARYCIYGCTGFSLGRVNQSRRRLWRPGQTRKVIYYSVVAKNTVDEKIARAIIKKQNIVDYIMIELYQKLGKRSDAERLMSSLSTDILGPVASTI